MPLRKYRLSLALFFAALFIALNPAIAAQIEVLDAEQLEYRPITLPDGSESLLIIISGQPAKVKFDDNLITAEYLEFDRDNRLVRIVGPGSFESEEEQIDGRDFVVDLSSEEFSVRDVLIVTEAIDVIGLDAVRSPGQIDVLSGAFSPCSRCNQAVDDYGFKAERLLLYPGDRLVAYDVTVLIREAPALLLPVLVIPLGPSDKQPRFSITQGTATERTELALDWPYVVGADAFGTASVRYYADVNPGTGNFFSENIFGGRIDTSYVGGGIDHRFFTDEGSGALELNYLPAFIDPAEASSRTQDEFTVRFRYDTLELLEIPQLNLLIERDDAIRQRLSEYRLSIENAVSGMRGRFFSQGYIDHDLNDNISNPSYANRNTPERTFSQLTLSPAEATSFSVGPFILSELLLELGVYEDASNPANRSAALLNQISAARLSETHRIELRPLRPWSGLNISGNTDFSGRYYSSRNPDGELERLIDWNSRLDLRQDFAAVGNLNLSFQRNTKEGETPFRFDTAPGRRSTFLRSDLSLSPLPWLSLNVDETYVFVDSRRPDNVGPGPINSTVTLFENLNWLSLSLEESYDIKENDPGNLEGRLTLRSPNRNFSAQLQLTHIQDLKPSEDRLTGIVTDESSTELELDFGYRPYLAFDLSGGYVYDPPEPSIVGDPEEFWQPLELGLTIGTLEQNDAVPGLRLSLSRDLNRGETSELGLELSASYAFLEASLEQRFDFQNERLGNSRYRLSWQNAFGFEASGFALLPPEWFGLTPAENQIETWSFSLVDNSQRAGAERWRLSYRTTRDPVFSNRFGETGGFRNSKVETRVNIEDADIGEINFGLRFSADLLLADDALARTYLSDVKLTLSSDFYGIVGLQGDLAYRASYNASLDEFSSARLSFDDLAITVRVLEELYLSTIFNDVWDLSNNIPSESPFNFQPVVYVVWDRCCWALYGSWDTATGQIGLTLTLPGSEEGFRQELDTAIRLPGRGKSEEN